jgi:hypothetical protein
VTYGHFFHAYALGGSLGLEFAVEGVEDGGETVAGFAFEDYGVGEDAVAGGVSGGVFLAWVIGPLDFTALARLAASCFSEIGIYG